MVVPDPVGGQALTNAAIALDVVTSPVQLPVLAIVANTPPRQTRTSEKSAEQIRRDQEKRDARTAREIARYRDHIAKKPKIVVIYKWWGPPWKPGRGLDYRARYHRRQAYLLSFVAPLVDYSAATLDHIFLEDKKTGYLVLGHTNVRSELLVEQLHALARGDQIPREPAFTLLIKNPLSPTSLLQELATSPHLEYEFNSAIQAELARRAGIQEETPATGQ